MLKSGEPERLRIDEACADFVERYPSYLGTDLLDRLRATEYRRLDERRQVYLDYTGGSIYAESQVQKHFDLLRSGVFGNPHSANPTSTAMTEHVERTRRYVLNYLNATVDDYILVFTKTLLALSSSWANHFRFNPEAVLCLRSTITTL